MSTTQKLAGKVAVITGASSGMGLTTAQLFVQHGAYVFITGRRQAELDAAVKLIGKEHVTAVQGDVSNLADLDRLYEVVKKEKGHLDIVFANAGIYGSAPLGAITEEHYDKLFNVNVKGLVFTVQKALPLLSENASVIVNASVVTVKGMPEGGIYAATKAAVRALIRSWILDLKGRNIRFNAVSPGPIDTPIFENNGTPKDKIDGVKEFLTSYVPMGRMGKSEEIANAVLFLASSDSSFVNGTDLFVDGGMTQV